MPTTKHPFRACDRWHLAALEAVRLLSSCDSESDYDRREPVRMVAVKQAARWLEEKMRCPDCGGPLK